jgi:hypothetical protein
LNVKLPGVTDQTPPVQVKFNTHVDKSMILGFGLQEEN